MKKIFLFVILGATSLLVCCKRKIAIIELASYKSGMMPYKHGQQAVFASNINDTVVTTIKDIREILERAPCANCATDQRIVVYRYQFMKGDKQFALIETDNRPLINVTVRDKFSNYQRGHVFSIITNEITSFSCDEARHNCLDSVVLNGKTFKNVLEISTGSTDATSVNISYYSKTLGFIGFKYSNGETYVLVK
jgi:hypothetical protein